MLLRRLKTNTMSNLRLLSTLQVCGVFLIKPNKQANRSQASVFNISEKILSYRENKQPHENKFSFLLL